ncbi:CaiB/BaiF CoA transferase family protein [Sneathiella sp.]|uniref:CaiB/BaiF CoA transferase family protein n=1 Tax=Sneathiella sp. TaxID=1964365 RepID=UPI003566E388
MAGVLDGLKVLDLSWGIAGPMTGMLLADQGADVTRIERPEGDPFGNLLGYKVWHRGKKNAVFNLKEDADKSLFLKLAADADIVIESFSPGVTDRLGIDYEALAKINPKLVYCSITGYGEGGENRDLPGYDALVAAKTGLQYEQRGWPEGSLYHMAGKEDPFAGALDIDPDWVQGANRDGPLFVASPWPSLGAFFSAITGISAALFAREKTGRGQKVSTSLHQGALACASGVWQRADDPDAEGYNTWIMGSASPKGHFQCKDGKWIHNWVPNPRFILEASKGDKLNSSPDLTVQNDPDRFGIGPEEILVMAHYQPILAEAIKKFNADEWVKAAAVGSVTMQEARSLEESLTDPLLIDDGCVTTVDDPELGPINQVGLTYSLANNPGVIQGPTRPTGSDTDAVKANAATLPAPQEHSLPAKATGDGPLKGIRVLDLGLAIAGPFGCQLLADMGAEVIKINTLWDGYWHRTHIAYMANRGKRSVALMLKHPKGMEALKKLIATCDVIQHNMRYPAVERLGLDYNSLKEEFPQLIYCHSRGFEKGPRMNLPGNDQTGACLSGIQHEDGALHTGAGFPFWSLTSLGDTGNGFLSASAICNALMEREKTGKGQFVDTSIVNAGLLNTSYAVAKPDGSAVDRPRLDKDQTGYSDHYRLYRCSDDVWIQVAAVNDAQKAAFDDVAKDGDFSSATAAKWLARLSEVGVPAAISDARASLGLFDDESMKQRGWTLEYQHPYVGKLEQIGATYSLSDTPTLKQTPPLIVGDNSASLLAEIGYSEDDIDAMAKDFAILCEPPREGQEAMKSPWGI